MGTSGGAHLTSEAPSKKDDPDAPEGLSKFVREKVFNREERYKLLCHIFTHLETDDYVSVGNIFEQYMKQNMGFVINQDD